jgi:hypothetical protein
MSHKLTDTEACQSGAHCATCRDLHGGRALREQWGQVFTMPAGGVDFECPLGKAWGCCTEWTPDQPSRGLGDTVAKITSAVGIKPCGGCKDRQATLNKRVPYKRMETGQSTTPIVPPTGLGRMGVHHA